MTNTILSKQSEKIIYTFDTDHERKRKEQLKRLHDRTAEQVNFFKLKINLNAFFFNISSQKQKQNIYQVKAIIMLLWYSS